MKHIDGRIGLIQRIDLKKTYSVVVVFEERVIKNIIECGFGMSEYDIETFTATGASDWRKGDVKITKCRRVK